MAIANEDFNLEAFSKKSEEYYSSITKKLEKKYSGKYVALDYGNKEFFIGETASNALSSAKVKNPDRLYYVKLIGAKSAFTIQSLFKGSLQRYKICT